MVHLLLLSIKTHTMRYDNNYSQEPRNLDHLKSQLSSRRVSLSGRSGHLMEFGGCIHLLKHIEIVIAGTTIRSQSYDNIVPGRKL